jgi:hypothetical protein
MRQCIQLLILAIILLLSGCSEKENRITNLTMLREEKHLLFLQVQ